ncbi:MAG: hypothetical protein ACPHF4_10980, partial [Rubripirellula sp.]
MSEINQTAEEERAFNAMLDEAFGGSQPPDLSSQILARYYNTALDSDSSVQKVQPRKSTRPNRSRSRQIKVAAVTITALAAMVAGVIALQPDHNITDSVTELVENAKRDDGEKAVIADSGNGKQTPKADKK